jgi:outer membrane protein assembly factor BamB
MGEPGSKAVPPPRRRGKFFRIYFPVLVVLASVSAMMLPRFWVWADFDPEPLFKLYISSMWAFLLGVALMLIWLLALSGLRWWLRLGILGLVIALGAGFVACIDHVDMTGDVGLLIVWKWNVHKTSPAPSEPGKVASLPPIDLTIGKHDFARYRGANADGIVGGLALAKDWKTSPPREVWRKEYAKPPTGFSGFAVAGNVAITIEQRGDQEAIVCYDRGNGEERWAYAYPANFKNPTGDGPRSTPTITDGDVYSVGAMGMLVCLEGKTGKKKWDVNILEDNQAANIPWAMTGSPLIVKNKVIVNPGIDPGNNTGRGLAAYDRTTGKRLWGSGKYAAGYSSPQLAKLAGREQVLLFDGGGLAGFDPDSGEELWRYPWTTFSDMNIIQPVVVGTDRVLISSETANGCAMLRVRQENKQFTVEPVWANRQLCAKFCNPVAVGGHIYGISTHYLVCLDEETGQRKWRSRKTYGHGQLLAVGDTLLVQDEFGELSLVAADPKGWQELGRVRIFDDPKIWNTPALAGGRLFLRDHLHMACYELPVQK